MAAAMGNTPEGCTFARLTKLAAQEDGVVHGGAMGEVDWQLHCGFGI
jgi:hypothetical protein